MPSKKRTIVIAMSIAVLLLITGFSLFSTRLTINGISEVTSSWKVYFESIKKTSVEGAATEASTPKIFNTTIEFEVNLRKPGDSITYTAVLKNGGTIGAIVNNIDASVTATESSTYTVTGIKKGDKLAAGASKEITIKVEYDRDYTAVPDEKTNDLIINIECVQDAGQTVTGEDLIIQKPKVIRANGDIDTVGTDLQIGNEHFYIISSDSTKVVALAKYNLDIDTGDSTTMYKGTGIQNARVLGYLTGTRGGGTIEYFRTQTQYWISTCTSYPCEIYNSQSYLYGFVESYKTYLEGLGAKISAARVISYDELIKLGCSISEYSCANAPSFVSDAIYWTSTAKDEQNVYIVDRNKSFSFDPASFDYHQGVRPVIEVPKSEISVNKKTVKIQANGDVTKVGTDIQIGDEHFYVISNSKGKITALAKYNVDVDVTRVGAEADGSDYVYKGTYKQNPDLANTDHANVVWAEGTSDDWRKYCSDSACNVYISQSSLYEHMEKYKTYLEGLGASIITARPIILNELKAIGCTSDTWAGGNACASAPSWVTSTTYWTNTDSDNNGWYYYVYNPDINIEYFNIEQAGVRPVIEIDASIFNVKANGDIDTVGTDIQIGNEHFYVISSDSSKVTALARYNLDVNAGSHIYKGTGLQDYHVVATKTGFTEYGSLPFTATNNYWSSTCTSYPCTVYGTNSTLYAPLESYKTYLNGLGGHISNIRLISFKELESVGCVASTNSCPKAQAWVYSTTYWAGDAINSYVYFVGAVGTTGYFNFSNGDSGTGIGARPVIEIPRSAFQ